MHSTQIKLQSTEATLQRYSERQISCERILMEFGDVSIQKKLGDFFIGDYNILLPSPKERLSVIRNSLETGLLELHCCGIVGWKIIRKWLLRRRTIPIHWIILKHANTHTHTHIPICLGMERSKYTVKW